MCLSDLYLTESRFIIATQDALSFFEKDMTLVMRLFEPILNHYLEVNGTLIMTQYPSLFEKQTPLSEWSSFCMSILTLIEDVSKRYSFNNVTDVLCKKLVESKTPYFNEKHVLGLKK